MIDFENLEGHTRHQKLAEEADELEWSAYELGNAPYVAPQQDDEISGQFVEMQSEQESAASDVENTDGPIELQISRKLQNSLADIDRVESRVDGQVEGVQAEIERRSRLLGEHYPFRVGNTSLAFLNESTYSRQVYLECLRISLKPTAKDRENFETLVGSALVSYLGKDRAKVRVFGWQSKATEPLSRRIKERMNELYAASHEWKWNPDVAEGFPEDPPPKLVKDLGLDAVAWLPMPDTRAGRLFVVAQCATGKTDWDEKLHDVCWDRLKNWIRPLPNRWSIRCFAIPFHLPNRPTWKESSDRAGLFLDRVRLTLLLKEA